VPTRLSDLVLLRQAINEDWLVADDLWEATIEELVSEFHSPDARRQIAVMRTVVVMVGANIRAENKWARPQVETNAKPPQWFAHDSR
jgi:hypothetical protein